MRARRLPVLDEYREDDQAVIFVNGTVVAISALATAVLDALGTGWRESSAVAVELVRRFGSPPDGEDPEAVAAAALQRLAGLGIVEAQCPTRPAPTMHRVQ